MPPVSGQSWQSRQSQCNISREANGRAALRSAQLHTRMNRDTARSCSFQSLSQSAAEQAPAKYRVGSPRRTAARADPGGLPARGPRRSRHRAAVSRAVLRQALRSQVDPAALSVRGDQGATGSRTRPCPPSWPAAARPPETKRSENRSISGAASGPASGLRTERVGGASASRPFAWFGEHCSMAMNSDHEQNK